MRLIVRCVLWGTVMVLTGCAQQARQASPVEPATPVSVLADPQRCIERADCTTKVSRTLLFVFDYAAVGGHLVQRQERLLFTPADAAVNDWPAIYIRLAGPADSRFDFNAGCRVDHCRYSTEELLRVYRSYLAGEPCSLDGVTACVGY